MWVLVLDSAEITLTNGITASNSMAFLDWDANIVLRDANNLGGTRFPSGGV